MDARAGNAHGEMTPVRRLKRTRLRMRAGRDYMRAGFNQLATRGMNPLPPGRHSRFDDYESVCSLRPEALQNRMPDRGGKFVEDIGQSDKVARSTIDGVNGGIRDAPGDVRRLKPSRESFAIGTKFRTCLDKHGIGESGPAFRRSPQRSAGARADIKRGLWRKIRASLGNSVKARADGRVGRRQTHREIGECIATAYGMRFRAMPLVTVAL